MPVVTGRPVPVEVAPRVEPSGVPTAAVALAPVVIAAIGVGTAVAGHDAWFSVEDGPAENAQFVLLVASAAVAARVAVLRGRRGERLLAWAYAGLACALVVLAGEEISWGQRLFGIATPPALASHNIQGELNLHNTYLMTHVLALGQLVLGLLVGVLPFVPLPRMLRMRHGDLLAAVVPPSALAPYFGMMGAWRAYRWTSDRSAVPVWVSQYGEVVELVLYLGIFLFVIGQLRSVTSGARGA